MPATLQPQVNPEASKQQDPNLPKTPAQAKLWPVDAGARAVESLIKPPISSSTQDIAEDISRSFGSGPAGEEPAKKKRKRTRKRKSATPAPTE
jgi:hypothetical protein